MMINARLRGDINDMSGLWLSHKIKRCRSFVCEMWMVFGDENGFRIQYLIRETTENNHPEQTGFRSMVRRISTTAHMVYFRIGNMLFLNRDMHRCVVLLGYHVFDLLVDPMIF